MQGVWQQLSKEISAQVARAGRSIVAVDARGGHTSSGIVWQPEFVLTASHTIRQDSAVIILESGKTVRAHVAGRAAGPDVALLKLDQKIESPPADFGDTTDLAVGELVVAVARTRRGNIVASSGILGGVMGDWQNGRTRIDQFIRADVNLDAGFSGGALIGSDGRALGMTSAGLLRGRLMTIPAANLKRVAEELLAKGHLGAPYVGLAMQPVAVPEALKKASGLSASAGLLVMHVEPSGPADNGGVLLGDVLVQLDGQNLEALEDLQETLRRHGPGQETKAAVIRGGLKVDLTIKIGERPLR